MWWSADGEMPMDPSQMPGQYVGPPVDVPDAMREDDAINALDEGRCKDENESPEAEGNNRRARLYKSFFKPLNDLSAFGAPRPLTPEEKEKSPEILNPPPNCAGQYFAAFGTKSGTRLWEDRTPLGMAYLFCHRPLYFEDANLERCGYVVGKDCCCCDWCCCCRGCGSHLQPAVSAAYFFGTIPLLPYKMTVDCPCECVPSLGRCPEGCRYSCCENYLPPWDFHAALVEAAVVTGAFFVIP
jgi:hypothetical protein